MFVCRRRAKDLLFTNCISEKNEKKDAFFLSPQYSLWREDEMREQGPESLHRSFSPPLSPPLDFQSQMRGINQSGTPRRPSLLLAERNHPPFPPPPAEPYCTCPSSRDRETQKSREGGGREISRVARSGKKKQ